MPKNDILFVCQITYITLYLFVGGGVPAPPVVILNAVKDLLACVVCCQPQVQSYQGDSSSLHSSE